MKKIAKVCAALSLCVGFTFSLAALSACGDDAMIDGDFTTEATAEQVTEVREYLSDINFETALGDTQAEDWSYNARFYTDGKGVSAQTEAGVYAVRLRLYELEERLGRRGFLRVSHSELVNSRKITALDLSLTGTIRMTLGDGAAVCYVSRRYVKRIKQALLGEEGSL